MDFNAIDPFFYLYLLIFVFFNISLWYIIASIRGFRFSVGVDGIPEPLNGGRFGMGMFPQLVLSGLDADLGGFLGRLSDGNSAQSSQFSFAKSLSYLDFFTHTLGKPLRIVLSPVVLDRIKCLLITCARS